MLTALLLLVSVFSALTVSALPAEETPGVVSGAAYRIHIASESGKYLFYNPLCNSLQLTELSGRGQTTDISYMFYIRYAGDGGYTITPLGEPGASWRAEGKEIAVTPAEQLDAWLWYIQPCDGGYTILSKTEGNPCVGTDASDSVVMCAEAPAVWALTRVETDPLAAHPYGWVYVSIPAHWDLVVEVAPQDGGWCGRYTPVMLEDGRYAFPAPENGVFELQNANVWKKHTYDKPVLPDMRCIVDENPGGDRWVRVTDNESVDYDLRWTLTAIETDPVPPTGDRGATLAAALTAVFSLSAVVYLRRRGK